MMQSMPRMAIGLVLSMLFALLAGCGTTVEKQQARFKKNKDTMEALAAKNPMMRAPVMAKLADFQKEHDALVAKGGEDAPRDLARLNGRVEEYVRKLDPSMAPKKTTPSKKLNSSSTVPPPGGKLGGTATGTAPAPTGKLGGTATGTAPAPTGKLGGAAPAPTGKLGGTATGTAPAPTGKLGGTAPTPAGKLGGTATGTAPAGAAPTGKLGGSAPAAPSGKLGQ